MNPLDTTIETERLILRVPTVDDAARMARFVTANREHFAPWDPVRSEPYFTESYWRTELARLVTSAQEGTAVKLVLLPRDGSPDRVLGQCTLSNIVRGPFQAAYLGYGLDRGAVGSGLMAEALRAVIAFGFDELKLHRLMANYMPTNTRSARLLRKLGFVVEGYARDYLYLAGAWRDHVLTALTNVRWGEQ